MTAQIEKPIYPTNNGDYTLQERIPIVFRCVLNRCPRCNHKGISSPLKFPDACPNCAFVYERHNGFLLSALPAVYFGYAIFWMIPFLVLYSKGFLSFDNTMVCVGVGAVLVPLLFFNYCKMLAIALYYFFLPRELYHEDLQDTL